ncbi:MAG TPA: toxin C-terminal domain-containing protein [Candidatus Babeliales bacterium]|nr:toxin C-terminal domain-containing protein [Candidatus Babeliales bacterium]
MKRLVRLIFLLFFVVFYSFNTVCIIENIPYKPLPSSLPPFFSSFSAKQRYNQEGFCGNTLVQTPRGYKQIKNLVRGDVVIDYEGQEKRIVAIAKKYVDQYVEFVVDNTAVYSGADQCYYTTSFGLWFSGQRVYPGVTLLNSKSESYEVTHKRVVCKKAFLYCLTVKDHTFSIAPHGLCVHNCEALAMGVSSMCLGNVIVINPIVAAIGAAIALSTIGHRAYQAYIQQYQPSDQKIVLPSDVVLAERSYYNQRTTALEGMKQELLSIKNGLENIKAFCGAHSESFTYQFLQKHSTSNAYCYNQFLKISDKNEALLSNQQKENLRILREIDLQYREQEIIDLQCILALHVDELIKQVDTARNEYTQAREHISNATALWNNNLSKMTYAIALQSYKADLLEEHLLDNFAQNLNELKIVAQYYTHCMNVMCVEQSTNVIDVLEKILPVIIECDQWVATKKVRVATKIAVSEKHFAGRGILITDLKSGTKNELARGRRNTNAQALADAKNKLASIVSAGGPNKNNKKNDDKDESNKDSSNEKNILKTTKEATEAAEKLGFEKTNYYSQRQPVFKKGNTYITPDRSGHNGGVWKMANSVKNLESRTVRMGTYDKHLNRIGD